MSTPMDKLEWHRIYTLHVGRVLVVFGSTVDPLIYAAAFSERELRGEISCGFGTTEAEAAVDLFRAVRDLKGPTSAVDVGFMDL